MIPINKDDAPEELIDLYNSQKKAGASPVDAYKALTKKPELKAEVRISLEKEQCHLCAYCMCKIPVSNVDNGIPSDIIEHIIPRNHPSGLDIGQGLDYKNLVVTCNGNQGAKGTRKFIDLTCDAHKKDKLLKVINPCKASTLASIYYKNNGEIYSDIPDVLYDLEDVLNLNCSSAPHIGIRKKIIDELWKEALEYDDPSNLLKEFSIRLETIENSIKAKDPQPAYIGVTLFILKEIIVKI